MEELKRERIIFQTFFFLGGGTSKPLKGLVVFCFFDFGRGGFFLEVHRKREGDVMFFFLLEDLLMVWRSTAIGLTMTLLFFQIMSWIESY